MSVKIFLGMFLFVPFGLLFSAEDLPLFPGMGTRYSDVVQGITPAAGTQREPAAALETRSRATSIEHSIESRATSPLTIVPRGLPVAPTISGEQLWEKSVEIDRQLPKIGSILCWQDHSYRVNQHHKKIFHVLGTYVYPAVGILGSINIINPEPGSKIVIAGVIVACKMFECFPYDHPQDKFKMSKSKYSDCLDNLEYKNAIQGWHTLYNTKKARTGVQSVEKNTINLFDATSLFIEYNKQENNCFSDPLNKYERTVHDFMHQIAPHMDALHVVTQYLLYKEAAERGDS